MKVIKTIKDKILFAYQLVAAITLVVLIGPPRSRWSRAML